MSTSPCPANKITFFPVLTLIMAILLTGCGAGGAITASSWPGISTDETTVYLAFNQFVHAIDLNHGEESWHYPEEPDRAISFFASPAIADDGLVIIGGYDKVVYALEPGVGGNVRVVWKFEGASDRIVGSPVVAGDLVLVPSADYKLYALDLAKGNPVWAEPFAAQGALWSAPMVEGDTVYLASLDHRVYALDLSSGVELWSTDSLNGAITDTPTLAGNLLLVSTFNRQMIALNIKRRGEVEWTFDAQGWVWGSPAVANGIAYFADNTGMAYAVDLTNAHELWRIELDGPVTVTPALRDGNVFFVTEAGTVYSLETDSGKSLWTSKPNLDGALLSDPVLTGDTLLVAVMGSECLVSAIDSYSGAVRCLFQPSE
ncbi:MAG: PQQ-binding-like beta-propeller repeat protein [Anaerolineales bacterium]